VRRHGAFCRRVGRVPAQLSATLSCGNRASVPLRLSSSGQGDSVTGVQGFFATTRLAAKAGKQPCSAAPWQTDVSDRPECMTGLTDPRHRCPSVFHGSTPAVGQAARYGAGGGWTRSATASALPKGLGLGRATPARRGEAETAQRWQCLPAVGAGLVLSDGPLPARIRLPPRASDQLQKNAAQVAQRLWLMRAVGAILAFRDSQGTAQEGAGGRRRAQEWIGLI